VIDQSESFIPPAIILHEQTSKFLTQVKTSFDIGEICYVI
jgi:hypothetical protein